MDEKFEDIVEDIVETKDPRYKEDAYHFAMEALSYAQKKYKNPKHVSSRELLSGIKELLPKKFGPLTLSVLDYWGIRSTEDFGNIIFNLVDNRVLTKTQDDSIEQFRDGFDFTEVFTEGYRKQLHKRVSRMR